MRIEGLIKNVDGTKFILLLPGSMNHTTHNQMGYIWNLSEIMDGL